jgi:formylglycine-generating enzyme required for sulfatase activity
MHHETLLYLLHRMPFADKRTDGRGGAYLEREPLARGRVTVDAGVATLGARRETLEFGWDNEFDERRVDVAAFEIDVNDVTNGDWLAFVRAGGPVPSFWKEAREPGDGFVLTCMFEEIPLPLTWPVYVTQTQAKAYAAWKGARLPTEAEYHRAAFGTPSGEERAFPWGDDPPSARFGNFDFRRFDPEPVGTNPAGASAWGVHDLIGNGWEWTSTPFEPFPGFTPMASYPQYSADFFDGEHFVVKGASPVTNRNHIRRSMRNWYRPDYAYVYATFRTVN